MRALVYSMAFLAWGAPNVTAGELPAALTQRLEQGVQACVDYYVARTSISSLQQYGFTPNIKSSTIRLTRPDVRQNVTVETLIEGPNDIECEVHANYDRHDTQKHAFNILQSVMTNNDFTRKTKHHYSSRAKTICERGVTSMFTKIRVSRGKLMIKFKRRSG